MDTDNVLNALHDEVIKLALQKVDTDALATELAGRIQKATSEALDLAFEDSNTLQNWIIDELADTKTSAGKQLHKALAKIATRMVKAV